MINFIIYEDKKNTRDMYIRLIRKLMGNDDCSYKIHEHSSYNEQLKKFITDGIGHKVYILDIEVPKKSGLDLAREIRDSGDKLSQLIVVSGHKEVLENTFLNRSLVLNFVSKFDNCEEYLAQALENAYQNITKYKSFVFKYEGDLYRIPYHDIYLFEIDKESGSTNLITKDKVFIVKKSISKILIELNDMRFMKTHKSCIVNLFNIEKVNLTDLVIHFPNKKKTLLFSRNYKKELQERLRM